MMRIGNISSYSASHFMREWDLETRNEMLKAGFEATTSRHYNMSTSLGYKIGDLVDISDEMGSYKNFQDLNKLAGEKLDAIQKSISSVFSADRKAMGPYQQFMASLLAAGGSSSFGAVNANADMLLGSMSTAFNTTYNGEYVFGGSNTTQPPLKDMAKAINVVKKAYIDYLSSHGKTPKTASSDDVKGFLSSANFNKFFDDKATWQKYFSNANDQRTKNHISPSGETIDSSSSVNAFKELIKSVVAIKATTVQGMSSDTYKSVLSFAQQHANNASSAFSDEQTRLGAGQNRVKSMDDFYNARLKILTDANIHLGGVDQEEAVSRQQALEQSLEISLNITARLSKLSLLHYM